VNDVSTFLCCGGGGGGYYFNNIVMEFNFCVSRKLTYKLQDPSLKQQQTKPICVHVFMCVALLVSTMW
jgi:hypothetical protein